MILYVRIDSCQVGRKKQETIRSYISQLRKVRHTAKMRESYSAATQSAGEVAAEWDAASDEAWAAIERPNPRNRG